MALGLIHAVVWQEGTTFHGHFLEKDLSASSEYWYGLFNEMESMLLDELAIDPDLHLIGPAPAVFQGMARRDDIYDLVQVNLDRLVYEAKRDGKWPGSN